MASEKDISDLLISHWAPCHVLTIPRFPSEMQSR